MQSGGLYPFFEVELSKHRENGIEERVLTW